MTMLKWTSISGSTDPSSLAHTNFPNRADARNIWCSVSFGSHERLKTNYLATRRAKPEEMHWWEFDEVNLVAAFLDGRALAGTLARKQCMALLLLGLNTHTN